MNIADLHAISPFEGFVPTHPIDPEGWNSEDRVFVELIEAVRPELIVEVGTWKGASALFMADHCQRLDLSTKIVCVDTWLGSLEFWEEPERYESLELRNGYPSVYFQFLSNVVHRGHAGRVIPFPQVSSIAARWMKRRMVKADLIYIDASHEADDVYLDVREWMPVLRRGGVMFGDDLAYFEGVGAGLDAFMPRRVECAGNKWIMRC